MHLVIGDNLYTELGDSIIIEVLNDGDVNFRNEDDCQLYELPGGSTFVGERNDAFESIKVHGFCEVTPFEYDEQVYVHAAMDAVKEILPNLDREVFKYTSKRKRPNVANEYRVILKEDVNDRHRFDNFPFTLEAKRIKQ